MIDRIRRSKREDMVGFVMINVLKIGPTPAEAFEVGEYAI